ncbi:MAG: hypothetical protein H3C48_16665 [Chitinophagaceae bacterium]|nr:hypothetical protein [Chitinophagaceae bacterium]
MLAYFLRPGQNNFRGFSISVFFSLFFIFGSFPTVFAQQKSTFTARLINIESATKDPFRFNTSLHNGSGRTQTYQLQAKAPDGWIVIFRTEGSQIAGLRLDSGRTQEISVEITATPTAKPDKYNIPVTAISGDENLSVDLEAVVKGSYSLELTTPTGRLSDDITEGSSKQIDLTVKNTGTLPLDKLEFTSQSPTQWSATFEPANIERLDPGQSQDIKATLKVPDKTIAGDYITTFTAKNNNSTANAAFRMTVKTSLLSGWLGILVILLAIGIIYYLIRKYGRR